ncbi:hypothetical protein [uncultured Enterovirga sp.]|uniref:hypothetical protein n=1 Tax=uncultured Enterovirga sp. TaxID=2026352 RepID=UPI0035CC2AB5
MPSHNDGVATELGKIRSEQLRDEAASGTMAGPHTVILEIDVPGPSLEVLSPRLGMGFGTPAFRIGPAADDKPADAERVVHRVGGEIERIIGRTPETFLASSGTFVVDATGPQLRELAKIPAITAIWPNTRR